MAMDATVQIRMSGELKTQVEELYRGACPKHDPVQCFDCAYAEAFIEECQPMLDDVWRRFQE